MRQKKAKEIRKKVYGDFSPRERKYVKKEDGSIRCVCKRSLYQKAKRGGENTKARGRSNVNT